ncbi:NAD(P)-binding protein [Venturia nashicola]|uniref:NAD(P)-binding protein n=1 Tax=Venturia nashicola TaxID=86259 RepID=A0A4Z1NS47_9PEZI|nr:NAD(P)-binding protein [Venturia nashicola]TLD29594.1 NAD(P)-binding protein [Venturia nashicola]
MSPSHFRPRGSTRQQDLAGKVAVITGASRGIGRAVAVHLASRGCNILGTYSQEASEDLIVGLQHEIEAISKEQNVDTPIVAGLPASIFSPTCAQDIASALQTSFNSQVDIFINNACDSTPGLLGELSVDEVAKSLVGNIQTPVLIVDELVRRQMFRTNSRIIYISSVRSRQPWSGQLMYAAGKSAGESLCRTWSMAFGGREEKFEFMAGTTANAVTVGLTETDAVTNCGPEMVKTFKQEFLPMQSIPRIGQPQDVADVVGMLCGFEARWITGTVVSASGGGIKIG